LPDDMVTKCQHESCAMKTKSWQPANAATVFYIAMNEFELKFEIPPASLPRVAAAMLDGSTSRQRLHAWYFDTPEASLAQHGLVVRVRKEGRRWVQTAKGPTTGPLERLEDNAPLPSRTAPGTLHVDLALHAATPVGKAIHKALNFKAGMAYPALLQLYESDVQRITRVIEKGGTVVELALDRGRVLAGPHSEVLCELEVELKAGTPEQAVELARAWCARYGLWLSSITKSMKGQRLQAACKFGPAVAAAAPEFRRQASDAEIFLDVLRSCLNQILPNASELAGGSSDPDHVHQLRIGIRRLRTALRELAGLTDGIDPAWEPALVAVFRELGRHRDQTRLMQQEQPQLQVLGGPGLMAGEALMNLPDSGETVRSPAFQDLLLCLAGLAHGTGRSAPAEHSPARTARKAIRLHLGKLHSQAIKDGKKFLSLSEERQHRVRKRLKRLKYLAEFSKPLFRARSAEAFIEALKPAQDALGLYNDELVALAAYRKLVGTDKDAWFGIGWFTARRLPNAERCLKQIRAFAKVRPFWD
jgi:triphosphatase